MKKIEKFIILGLWMVLLAACVEEPAYRDYYSLGEAGTESFIELEKVEENVYIHRSYMTFGKTVFPGNGLIVVGKKGLLMVDTPWNDEQTEALIALTNDAFGKPILTTIVTHAHDDTIGGIASLLEKDVEVLSTQLTYDYAVEAGYESPTPWLDPVTSTFEAAGIDITTYYPGGGHTEDNIVVYLNDYDILYAGCLIKEAEANQIGNTADANINHWAKASRNVADQFPDTKLVIPGHGDPGDLSLIDHTIEIVEAHLKEVK